MSTQSCVVVCALLALIMASIVNIGAFSSPHWIKVDDGNWTVLATRGLWQECNQEECFILDFSELEAWFRAVQSLFTIGLACGIVSLLIFCSIFAADLSTEKTTLVVFTVMATNILSSICLSITLGIFLHYALSMHFIDPEVSTLTKSYDWVFYASFWGVVFSVLSTILIIWEGCMAATWFNKAPYYDI